MDGIDSFLLLFEVSFMNCISYNLVFPFLSSSWFHYDYSCWIRFSILGQVILFHVSLFSFLTKLITFWLPISHNARMRFKRMVDFSN